MKSEEERKISFKIRFIDPSKPQSKPVNKVYAAKETEFTLDFLLSKCSMIFKDSKFTLQLLANQKMVLDQQFVVSVISRSRKGEQQQLIFVCEKGQQMGDSKGQLQTDNSSKQKSQVLQKHSSAKVTQEELPKSEIGKLKQK